MKKYIFLLFSFFLLFTPYARAVENTPGSTEAIEPAVIGKPQVIPPMPPIRIQPSVNIFGQEHYYSVTFRGNGEAVVLLKAILANNSDDELSEITLRIPKVKPEDIGVFQVLRERRCLGWRQPANAEERALSLSEGISTPLYCSQYDEPDFYQGWGGQTYQKADFEYSGDTIAITLPRPIGANSSGSYILTYSAFGYAKKNIFGAYDFTFQTPQVEDKIYTLQIGIDTDSDLVLRGGETGVDYRFDSSSIVNLKSVQAGEAISSPSFDAFYQEIGYGQITKDASRLQPLESYEVKGSYGESRLQVYGQEILMGIVILLIVLILLVIVAKYIYKRQQKSEGGAGVPMMLEVLGIGFSSSFVIVLYTVVVYFANTMLLESVYIGSNFQPLFMLLSLVVSVGVYAVLFLGPSIYIYTKKGLGWAQVQFVTTVVFVLVYLVIFAVFSMLYRNPEMYKTRPLPSPARMEIESPNTD